MNRYRDIIERINYGLFLTVVALLPFPQLVLRYACVLWIISWTLELRWLKTSNIKHQTSHIPFFLFGLWFGWKALSGLWAADSEAWAWQLERYLSFVLLIPVGIWGLNDRYNWQTVCRVLACSCAIAIPLYVGWMFALFHHPEWVPYLHLEEPWIHHDRWWIFLSENISHFKHRLFLCSVELMGVIAAWQVYRKRLWVFIPMTLVMLSSIALTDSRQAVISAVVLLCLMILYMIPRTTYRWMYGSGIVLAGVLIGYILVTHHPRMQQVQIRDFTEMRNMSYDHDIRFNIWGAALKQPKDYIAYGLGAGQSETYLGKRYAEVHFDYYAQKKYHAHNQYLEELMEIGIPGLVLFILAWLSIPLCAKKEGRQTAILFTSLFMLNMFTDCMFGKFCGIALWAVGLVLIFLQSNAQRDE